MNRNDVKYIVVHCTYSPASMHVDASALVTGAAGVKLSSVQSKVIRTVQPSAPEHGHFGDDVAHENLRTATSDWSKEYGPATAGAGIPTISAKESDSKKTDTDAHSDSKGKHQTNDGATGEDKHSDKGKKDTETEKPADGGSLTPPPLPQIPGKSSASITQAWGLPVAAMLTLMACRSM